jgi:hypothetical protein
VRQVDYLERICVMNSLVKTSKMLAAVAMLSALFACGQEGGEGATSGATAGSTGASSADSGTGNPALDGILSGGDTDTAATAEAPAADTAAGETESSATGSNTADPSRY